MEDLLIFLKKQSRPQIRQKNLNLNHFEFFPSLFAMIANPIWYICHLEPLDCQPGFLFKIQHEFLIMFPCQGQIESLT